MKTIVVTAQVRIPKVPNFLRYGEEETSTIDVADVLASDLRAIGRLWTTELLENSKRRREAKGKPTNG